METNRSNICQRAYAAEMRAETNEENNEYRLIGYASVYDCVADIDGLFNEVIERGAFIGCKFKDVIFCVNHETTKIPLARSRNNNKKSTMQLNADETGLHMNSLIDAENNTQAAALYSATQRGDMGGMSMIFKVAEERWEGLDTNKPTRYITKIEEVYEVTAATFPYYKATTLDARAERSLASEQAALESAKKEARAALESARASKDKQIYKLRAKIGI
ncbi:MAG: HK97 family phage prohead protease [Lachnospiraceae bacterium]